MVTTGARGFRSLRLVFNVQFNLLDGRVDAAAAALAFFHFEPETVVGANLPGDFLVNGLVDTGKDAQLHQIRDDLKGLAFELFGQFAHDDGRLKRDDLARCQAGQILGGAGGAVCAGRARRDRVCRWHLLAAGPEGRRETAPDIPAVPAAAERSGRPPPVRRPATAGTAGFAAGLSAPRGGLGGQLDEAHLVANLRAGRRRRRRRQAAGWRRQRASTAGGGFADFRGGADFRPGRLRTSAVTGGSLAPARRTTGSGGGGGAVTRMIFSGSGGGAAGVGGATGLAAGQFMLQDTRR